MKQNYGNSGWRLLMFLLRVTTLGMLAWLVFMWFQSEMQRTPAQIKTAQADFVRNDPEAAHATLDQYLLRHSTNPEAFERVIGLCMNFRQWQTAMSYAQQGLRQCNDTTAHERAALYTALSDACYMQGGPMARPSLAAARQAYVLDPTDPGVLNTLGYVTLSLSTDPLEISRGMQYVEEALKRGNATPLTNAGVLAECEDSYAWGLYRLSIYGSKIGSASSLSQALAALNQAVADLPKSAPASAKAKLYIHLAIVNEKAGQAKEAITAARVALFYDSQSKRAQRIIARLSSGGTSVLHSNTKEAKSTSSSQGSSAPSHLITAAFTSTHINSYVPHGVAHSTNTTVVTHNLP